jgi:hypothetical protein
MRQVRVEAMYRHAGAGGETLIGASPIEKGSNLKTITGSPPLTPAGAAPPLWQLQCARLCMPWP